MTRFLFKASSLITILALVLMGLPVQSALAAGSVSLTALDVAYTQNFDTLPSSGSATWTNDSTIPGWFHARTGTGTTIVADAGTSTAGNLYSYGASLSTDRALGSIGSTNTAAGNFFWGVRLVNNTGSTITSLDVAYVGEQWRNSAAAAQTISFSYLVGNPTVTGSLSEFQTAGVAVSALDFTSPITGGTASALVGNSSANRVAKSFTITGLSIPNGTEAMLRWSDPDHSGSDHGLSIDDFSVTPHSSPLPNLTINDVTQNEGNSGTTSFQFTVSLSAPAATNVTFDIATADGTATAPSDYAAQTLTGQTIAAGSTSTSFTVSVNGDTTDEPNETFTVNLTNASGANITDGQGLGTITNDDSNACSQTYTPIYNVQGSGSASPWNGSTVTVRGVVVGDFQTGMSGFDLQDKTGDGDVLTSDGVFVFVPTTNALSSIDVAVGDDVVVTGRATEFNTLTEIDTVTAITKCGTDSVAPTAVTLPETVNGDLERYEGMLVSIAQTLTVEQNFFQGRYGQVTLGVGRLYQATNTYPAGSPQAIAAGDLNGRSLLVLDDATSAQNINPIPYIGQDNTLRAGDTSVGTLTGVLDYGLINSDGVTRDYRLQPTASLSFTRVNARTTAPDAVGGNVKVASFNVLNYFNGDGQGGGFPTSRGANTVYEFNRQRDKIIAAILAINPDVAGLMEMENDGTGTFSAIQDLVNGLNAATAAGTYAFVAEPGPGTDEIKVAMIYKPAAVSPVGAAVNYQVSDPSYGASLFDRPPLAQTFQHVGTGAKFTVIVNHFKSKGSCPTSGVDTDQGDGQGCWNTKRVHQAQELLNFIADRKTASGDNDVLVIGDLNSYGMEDPIQVLTNGGLVNEINKLIGATAYSYVFDGLSGYLDHALASSSLDTQVSGVTEWHINADEPSIIDYNVEFKNNPNCTSTTCTSPDLYTATPYRASDHDPVVVGLNLTAPVTTPTPTNTVAPTDTPTPTLPVDTPTPTNTATPTNTPSSAGSVVISQIYGGGGNTYLNDYVELYNRSSSPVNISGWSVQYASASGTGTFAGNGVTLLSGTIQPSQYYLVAMAAGASGTALPTPDASGNVNMSATAGKVIIANTTTGLACNGGSSPCSTSQLAQIVDLVGYGSTANFYEGSGPAPAPSSTTAVLRLNGGATDTNNNNSDFTTGAPNPRNSSFGVTPTPTNTPSATDTPTMTPTPTDTPVPNSLSISDVTLAEGNSGTTAFNFTVSLSSPAGAGGVTFDISTGDNTATVANNDYAANSVTGATISAGNNSTTFTVLVNGDTTVEPDETFFVNISNVTGAILADGQGLGTIQNDDVNVCLTSYTHTYDIQGSGASAAITGTVTTQGVVVGDYEYPGSGSTSNYLRGFYLQDLNGDGNAATSDGIFIFNNNNNNVSTGDVVRVTGNVSEFNNQTQITLASFVNCGTGTVAPTDVNFPVPSTTYLEQYEGMLVRLPQTMYVTEHFLLGRFGEVLVSSGGRLQQPTSLVAPGAPALAMQASNDLNRIVIDDAQQSQNPDPIVFGRGGIPLSASNTLRGGDSVTGLIGVLGYTDATPASNVPVTTDPFLYRIRPVNALGGGVPNFQPTNPRPTSAPTVGGTTRVAGMNLLNFFNTFDGLPDTVDNCTNGVGGTSTDCRGADTQAEFDRQWPKTVAAILALNPDVLGVNEIENDGYGSTSAIQFLVDKLNAVTAPGTYAFINVDANTGQVNAMGTDAIKVALIYKPAKVTPVGQTAVLNSTTFVNGGDGSPRSRPTIAQAFEVAGSGARFIVDVNHLKSKGSACDIPDAGDGQGNCSAERTVAADALMDWLGTDPTGTGDPDILLVGDYNSYAKEDPITRILQGVDGVSGTSDDFTNLILDRLGPDAYSYVFDGQWGYLDHALASPSIVSQITGVGDYHINSDEPSVLDYNTDFKTANLQTTLYAPDQFRVSDHDSVLIGLNLNTSPVANNDSYMTAEDTALTVVAPGVLTNDTDGENNALTAILVANPSHGMLTFHADGSFTYTPAANFNGSDSFTYKASDGSGSSNVATVNLTVTAVNDAPVAVNDSYSTDEDTALTVPAPGVLSNDTDVESNSLTAIKVTDPAHGTVTVNANGSFTYTPASNYNGPDSFTYKANDGTSDSNTATVSITVNAANDAPVCASPQTGSTSEDTTLNGSLTCTDAENDSLTYSKVSDPAHGTLTVNANGTFAYSPTANYNGSDSFTFKANDGTADSNTATFNITVTAVNDAPVATNDSYSTNEDTALTVLVANSVLNNDSDVDNASLTAVLVTGPTHGTLALNTNGSFTYTPAANYNGSDSFTYKASDGTATSNTATVSITVNAVNDAPVAGNDSYSTNEDTAFNIVAPGVLGNDTDVDSASLTAAVVTGPAHGTLVLNANGSFTYTPAANYNGADSFTYKASDGTATSNTATVSITVNPVNDAPVAVNDSATVAKNSSVVIYILSNDTDVDGDTLTVTTWTQPAHGTVAYSTKNKNFRYTPARGFTGTDTFTYTINDGHGGTATATVTITVH